MAPHSLKSLAIFTATFLIFSVSSAVIFKFMQEAQPTPYMDEIFHIPQAQEYCAGKFEEWNPKITTLPGLYLLSIGILTPMSKALGRDLCDIYHLRIINVLLSCGNLYLLYYIVLRLHSGSKDFNTFKAIMTALNLALFPTMYFFSFLYYTDIASCYFVLLMYLFHLHGQHFMAAMIGLMSIFIRQTNIIWVAFMGAEAAFEIGMTHLRFDKKDLKHDVKTGPRFFLVLGRGIMNLISHQRKRIPNLLWDLELTCLAYGFVGVAFLIFVLQNKGIAVGDRSAHQACLHIPQLLYFLAFTLAFSAPFLITPRRILHFFHSVKRKPFLFIALILAALLAITYNTHVHAYLLADNRHYTNILWRRIFQWHSLAPYALIPVYLYASWTISQLFRSRDFIWKMLLFLAICAATIPQKLLEFRYFILPYLFIRLNMPVESVTKLVLEFMLYMAVNATTVYLYTQHVFYWEDSSAPQRYIW